LFIVYDDVKHHIHYVMSIVASLNYPMQITLYFYNEFQVVLAIGKCNYKSNCKTLFFSHNARTIQGSSLSSFIRAISYFLDMHKCFELGNMIYAFATLWMVLVTSINFSIDGLEKPSRLLVWIDHNTFFLLKKFNTLWVSFEWFVCMC